MFVVMSLVGMVVDPPIVLMVREPRAASPWVQSVRATCGKSTITISGYGAGRPLAKSPEISVNGRPVRGGVAARLKADLSRGRAVYRLQILCSGSDDEVTVRVNVGEKPATGDVEYKSGAAYFKRGRLDSYTGLEASDADGFWFR
jgi:hypothetical protein